MSKIEVGDTVYGFAGGHFGRDSYGDKVCIHTGFYGGSRYAVFYTGGRYGGFATISGSDLTSLESDNYTSPEEEDC